MGQVLIIADIGAQAALIAVFGVAEEVLILLLPAALEHQLAAGAHNIVQALADEVDALVPHQAADHGENGHVALHLQTQLLLQGLLTVGLAPEAAGAVMGREHRVRGRVKHGGINAV